MTEAVLEAELVAACSSLGYSDGHTYVRDPDCVETIRDLIRYLRRDDSHHRIRLALGDIRVVQTDLLPLLQQHSSDSVLLDLLLRLLVNLTTPALIVFHHEVPQDKTGRQTFLKLIAQQQGFKEAFTSAAVWVALAGILGAGLGAEGERGDDASLLVEMCLVLLRNVLAVQPGRQDDGRTHDDADVHDQVLWSLHLAGLPDLLLYLVTADNEQDLALHALEITSLMLRQQDPQALATSAISRSLEDKKKDEEELMRVRQAEFARKQQQIRKQYSARHSRFGGTYYIQNMKSISDRDIISHKPVLDINSIDFDRAKRGKKIPKHRAPMQESSTTRRSTLAIRLFLQEFCVEFLNGAYNNIMYIVKDNLNRAKVQEHDESYYLWAMKFFMEFNRHHEFKVELISETLSVQTIHYIQTNIETYYDTMTTDKKKIPLWSRRMHNGLRAYQEVMMTLAAMDKSPDPSVRSSSLALKSKIFYVVEYRELPLSLLQNYTQLKMTKSYLKDLVEMTHVFLKLLQGMCQKTKHMMVQKSGKKKLKKKKKKTLKESMAAPSQEKLEEMWSLMADELSAVIQGQTGDLPPTVPFDAISDKSEDEQKEVSMRRINALLRNRELGESVSLFRSSREVWPEGGIFGAPDTDHAAEFIALREVFMTDLNPVEQETRSQETSEEDEEEDELTQEMGESSSHISEQELNFTEYVRKFSHINIIRSYALLLKSYTTNSAHTNRCIIKMFHRIAWDSKMPAIFFQSSLFATFHAAMTDPASKNNEMIGEVVKFAKYIVRQFFVTVETNPKVFMEILFWKTNKDALEIECGYDLPVDSKTLKTFWTEEEDDEITRLYEEFKDKEVDPVDEKDLADMIMQNLISQDRTRRMVIKKLKDLGLVQNLRQLSRKSVKVPGKQWTEMEETELKVLFEEYHDSMDPLGRIMDYMIVPKPKHRIVEKLLELGLVHNKSELKKKKVRLPKLPNERKLEKFKNNGERFLAANNSGSESENDIESAEDESDGDHLSQTSMSKTTTAPLPVVTPYLICVALKKVLEGNMQESVQWISELLAEVADDREQDGDFGPIPILAISPGQSEAIDNEDFQSLLKVIGVNPPQTHEEMFWRIPSRLSIEGLRKRSQYLNKGLEGTLVQIEGTEESTMPLEPVIENIDTERNKSKSAKTKRKNKKVSNIEAANINEAEFESDKENDDTDRHTEKKVKKRKSRVKKLDKIERETISEEEVRDDTRNEGNRLDSEDELLIASSKTSRLLASAEVTPKTRKLPNKRILNDSGDSAYLDKSISQITKKKRRIVVDDIDDDEELPVINTENLVLHLDTEDLVRTMDVGPVHHNPHSVPRARIIEDSDDETEVAPVNVVSSNDLAFDHLLSNVSQVSGKRTTILDSDSDDDSPLVKSRVKAIIMSDDED